MTNSENKKAEIFTRVFAWNFGASALIIALFAIFSYAILERVHRAQVENLLSSCAEFLAADIRGISERGKSAELPESLRDTKVRASIIRENGDVIFDTSAKPSEMLNHANRSEIKQALSGKKIFVSRYSDTLKSRMIYYSRPAGLKPDGSYEYCVRLAMPMERITLAKKLFAAQILAMTFLACLISLLISYFFARRISTPIKALTNSARELAQGNFDTRVANSNLREISELGDSISTMARESKLRIRSLNKRNCELDEIFEHMSEPVFICAQDGTLRRYNSAAAKLFSIKKDLHKARYDAVLRDHKLLEIVSKTFSSESDVKDELEFRDSKERTFAIVGVKLPYEFATPRALFVMHDISYISQNEKLRREFVNDVSHELKTPITAIKMASETMKSADANESARFLGIIDKETDRLTCLVNDMLLLSRIEFSENYGAENFQNFKLKGAIDEAVSINENDARLMGDSIAVNCPDELEINGDFTLIRLALSNLVSNAVKYGLKDCKIAVSASRLDGERVQISVSDTGPGIAPEHASRVFERFYRIDKGRSRALGGTGLGLAIVKHVCILHSGSVSLNSIVGKGSIFTMNLKG